MSDELQKSPRQSEEPIAMIDQDDIVKSVLANKLC